MSQKHWGKNHHDSLNFSDFNIAQEQFTKLLIPALTGVDTYDMCVKECQKYGGETNTMLVLLNINLY